MKIPAAQVQDFQKFRAETSSWLRTVRTLKVDGEPIRRPPATKKTKNATVNGLNEIQKGQKLKINGTEYGVIKTVCDRTNPKLKIILTLGTPIAADQISEAIAAAAAEKESAAEKSVGRLFIDDKVVKFCKFKKDRKQLANPLTLTTDTDTDTDKIQIKYRFSTKKTLYEPNEKLQSQIKLLKAQLESLKAQKGNLTKEVDELNVSIKT